MKNLIKVIATFAIAASMAYGQTILSTTTLGAAITTSTTTNATVTLASTSTMQNMGTQNNPNTVLYIDKEFMWVVSVIDSTHVSVARGKGIGQAGRPMAHANAATVWFANSVINSTTNPSFNVSAASFFPMVQPQAETFGSCTASATLVLPKIYLFSGDFFDCLGGVWVQTDQPGRPSVGSVVASVAGVIAPTGTTFHVSGNLAITGITVPHGFSPGMTINVIPDGTFTWTTATNISLAGTAVVNKVIIFTWDGTKWNPSVIA